VSRAAALAGTASLLRLGLRLDRRRLAVWVLALPAVVVATGSAFQDLYPTVASRLPLAVAFGANPALRALVGPAFDLSSVGGLTMWRVGGIGAVLVALLSLLTVVRHTRAEEEDGRLELVRAGVVGRFAPLTAALALAGLTAAAVGAASAGGLVALGLPAGGSLAMGLALASTGWVFAALGALAAQLPQTARSATGLAGAALSLAYLLRAAGDAAGPDGPSWLSWLSPIGWAQQLRPFTGERWSVLGLPLLAAVGLLVLAYGVLARRDLGSGVLAARAGPARGTLQGASALALRLQRGALLGWAAGAALVGLVLGAVARSVGDVLRTSPQLAALFQRIGGERALVDGYLAATMGMVGLLAAAYGLQAALRLRTEEIGLRAEPLLATATSRWRWAAGHLFVAGLGATVLLALAGGVTGVVHGLRTGDVAGQTGRLLAAALVQLPAVLVMVGLAVALFGLAPRLVAVAWAALAGCLLLTWLGQALQLDERLRTLSPFAHIPSLPGGEVRVLPMVLLVVTAVGLTGVGLAGFARRDLG
jgi:ABC-2 type transport system permease protein